MITVLNVNQFELHLHWLTLSLLFMVAVVELGV